LHHTKALVQLLAAATGDGGAKIGRSGVSGGGRGGSSCAGTAGTAAKGGQQQKEKQGDWDGPSVGGAGFLSKYQMGLVLTARELCQ
jgi:hypothetical protein